MHGTYLASIPNRSIDVGCTTWRPHLLIHLMSGLEIILIIFDLWIKRLRSFIIIIIYIRERETCYLYVCFHIHVKWIQNKINEKDVKIINFRTIILKNKNDPFFFIKIYISVENVFHLNQYVLHEALETKLKDRRNQCRGFLIDILRIICDEARENICC